MSSSSVVSHRWLLAICLAALVIRLVLVLHAGERELVNDENGYDNIAAHLVSGHGYQIGVRADRVHPTASRGPTYVFYVAAFYSAFGHRIIPPLVGQCVLEAISCLLAFFIARRLFRSARGATMAAALYAFYPPFILNAAQLITETVTNFLILAALAAFLQFIGLRRGRALAVSGLCVGLGALVKPTMAPLGAVFALAAAGTLGLRRALGVAAVTCLVAGIVISPWVIRNWIVFDEFIPGVTLVGYTFWGGTAPGSTMRTIGSMSDPTLADSTRARLAKVEGELERSHWYMEEGMRVIKRDPWRYVRLSFMKIPQLWLNIGFDEPPSRRSWLVAVTGVSAFALAIVALRSAAAVSMAGPLLLYLCVFWTLANLPAPVLIRYAMPVYAVLFCFTGPGLDEIFARMGGKGAESAREPDPAAGRMG